MKTTGLKIVGKGAFSTVYELNEKQVLIKSSDPIKECMSMGWFPDSRLFPKVEYLDSETYVMQKFAKVKSPKSELTEKDYSIYLELRALKTGYVKNSHWANTEWHKQFDTIKNKRVREALKDALDACCNYGSDINFEISPRNIAVKNGKLILLDCFFSISKLNEVRSKGKRWN